MSTAHEIVTIGAPTEHAESDDLWVSVKIECSACNYVAFTGTREHIAESRESWIADHIAQHRPGRALDIAVDWEPVAYCSVCDDGIGDIAQEDDGLTCRDCGARWDMDGTGGEAGEDE